MAADVSLIVPDAGTSYLELDGVQYPVTSGVVTVPGRFLSSLLNSGYRQADAYGSANEANEAGSDIVLTTAASMYPWITGTPGPCAGPVSWDDTNKRLVIGAGGAGVYAAHASGAGTLSGAADIEAAIFVNEVESILRVDQAVAVQATYQPFSVGGLLTLAAGDYVSLRMSSGTNSRTWAMRHCQFSIVRVG